MNVKKITQRNFAFFVNKAVISLNGWYFSLIDTISLKVYHLYEIERKLGKIKRDGDIRNEKRYNGESGKGIR
ncbi:hypothetical protein GCM10011384_32520 [Psychrobacillus lasiicapitis]|nr:hypothetical protein GCM10011384_32520 [Psychrobacillus lasiicapitis]